MVITLNAKKYKIKDVIIPYKKINYFMIGLIILGIICGTIFFIIINNDEKQEVIKQINNFFKSIDTNTINNGLAFKNSLYSNLIILIIIWILGMSVIGLFINIFLVYLKSFIIGFSISSIIATYGIKGIPASIIYIFPHQIINLLAISIMGIYSILFSIYIIKLIIKKNNKNNRSMIKKYMLIFIITIIMIFIASLLEAYFLPALMKLIIKLYI